ncbi:MAG: response regulator [Rubrivivax sp.]|nr:response regulator [Rubrivivax sp.]
MTGFTRFEQVTFESVFRLAAQRETAYCLVATLHAGALVIVNADSEVAVAEVQRHGLLARALMLGATPRAGAGQQLPRPINPMLVLRALDTLVRQGLLLPPTDSQARAFDDTVPAALGPARIDLAAQAAPSRALPAGSVFTLSHSLGTSAPHTTSHAADAKPIADSGVSTAVQRVLDDLMHITATLSAATDARALAAAAAAAAASDMNAAVPTPAVPAVAETPARSALDHILIVDGSDVALRFMSEQLQRFGFEVHLARSGTQALEHVAKRHFAFVFIDVTMHGIDGLHTCKAIKHQAAAGGLHSPAPTVVLMTTRSRVADRLRFKRAGADACLVKPLREAELLKIVGDREVALNAYAETAAASSTLNTLA